MEERVKDLEAEVAYLKKVLKERGIIPEDPQNLLDNSEENLVKPSDRIDRSTTTTTKLSPKKPQALYKDETKKKKALEYTTNVIGEITNKEDLVYYEIVRIFNDYRDDVQEEIGTPQILSRKFKGFTACNSLPEFLWNPQTL